MASSYESAGSALVFHSDNAFRKYIVYSGRASHSDEANVFHLKDTCSQSYAVITDEDARFALATAQVEIITTNL